MGGRIAAKFPSRPFYKASVGLRVGEGCKRVVRRGRRRGRGGGEG